MQYRKSVPPRRTQQQARQVSNLPPTGFEWRTGTVTEIADGDTLHFFADNENSIIRLIGIDTPELGKKDARNEIYALEAKKFLSGLVLNKPLNALLTLAPATYKRKLGYLFTPGGDSINEQMVAGGYAFAARGFSFPEQSHYLELEANARTQQIGMWKAPPKLRPDLASLLPEM